MARVERHLTAEAPRALARVHPAALAALAVALLFGVGVGAGRSLVESGGSQRLVDPSSYVGDLLLVVVTVAVIGLGVLVYSLMPERPGEGEQERAFEFPVPWSVILYMVGVTVAAIGVLTAAAIALPRAAPTKSSPRNATAPLSQPHARHGQLPVVHWWGVVAAAVVLTGAAVGLWLLARRRPQAAQRPADGGADVRDALTVSLRELELERDARAAVIRAYARMEDVLARHELGRAASETSPEHLRRTLVSLRVSAVAAQRLATLFERAKFSPHAIGAAMKREAIAALAAVRDELEAA